MRHAGTQPIATARLTMRELSLCDAEMMFSNWRSDDDVALFMRWTAHSSVEDTEAEIRELQKRYLLGNTYHWGLFLGDGTLIGVAGVRITSEDDLRCDAVYSIGKAFWGQGYTSEALKAVIDYMYTNTDIERIEAYHSVQNPASGGVLSNVGMSLEGHSRHKYRNRDGFQNCNLYGIIRDDWERSK